VIHLELTIEQYNLMREGMAEKGTPEEEVDKVFVSPKWFALKKQQEERVILSAQVLLHDKAVFTGLTPLHTIKSNYEDTPSSETILYVLFLYAVCIQQGWLTYSKLLNKFIINPDHNLIVEYIETVHNRKM
jgi:hypothetical protein